MQASTKFASAIHICIYLHYSGKDLVSSSKLAESVKTNPVVIRRLVGMLRAHHIIESVAGAQGGFRLVKSPETTNLWDIYLAVRDEDFFQRPKVNPDCVISSNLKVLVYDVFSDAELAMKEKFSRVSIASLTEKLKRVLEQEKHGRGGGIPGEELVIF